MTDLPVKSRSFHSLRKLGKEVMELEVRELNPMFDAMKEFSQTLDRAKELSEAISKGVYEQSSVVAKEVGQLS